MVLNSGIDYFLFLDIKIGVEEDIAFPENAFCEVIFAKSGNRGLASNFKPFVDVICLEPDTFFTNASQIIQPPKFN